MSTKEEWRPKWHQSDVYIQNRELKYHGFCQVVRYSLQHPLFRGSLSPVIIRERVERRKAAAVLLYDPLLERVVLVEQFRVGALGDTTTSPWLLELVAGLVDEGESPEETVYREAQEEAGCVIEKLLPIVDYYTSPGGFSERTSLFCGLVKAPSSGGLFGIEAETEDIQVHILPLTVAIEMVDQGVICNGSTIIALQWLVREKVNIL